MRETVLRAIRWGMVAVFGYFTLYGHRWPIVVFMCLQQLANDLMIQAFDRRFTHR